jgi:kynurenine formamidase
MKSDDDIAKMTNAAGILLKAPAAFFALTPSQIADISNGCGPKGWGWVVPNHFRLIGVDFQPACDIHDYMYGAGYEKQEADNLFLENMMSIVKHTWFPARLVAEHFAFIYYLAVKHGGGSAYKNAHHGKF